MKPLRDNARILVASAAGTAVEYYDFFLYGTAAALVFGPLFFPAELAAAQTLYAFMSFGIAFVARPIGAIAFGHFGDRVGRKSTLVASLLLMGAATLAIAFLPTYAMVGWIAPALLCTLRFCQGFGLGGEWGGAALLVVENAPKGWETRFVSIMQLGSPVGFIAATGVMLVLSLTLDNAAFMAWGWRVPFVASALLVGLGLWVRLNIGETAAFRQALDRAQPERVPLAKVFSQHSGAVLAGAAGVIATFTTFYMVTTFALAQGTGPAGYSRDGFLAMQILAALFYAVGLVLAGIMGDRSTPGRLLAFGSVAVAASGLVFGPGLNSGSLPLAGATLCLAMLALGFANCPLGAWLAPLFPVRVRYSGVSFAFSIGGVIGGALTPIGAQALSTAGYADYVGLLMVAGGLLTFLGVLLARPVEERIWGCGVTGLAEQLKARLRQDLKAAMQARQSTDAKLLRVILAAIDNAEAVPVAARPQTQATRFTDGSAEAPRRDLSSHELGQVLEAEIAARLAAAEHYDRLARPEEATRLRAETEIVRRYLSKG